MTIVPACFWAVSSQRTSRRLKSAVPSALISLTQRPIHISRPRALSMPSSSTMSRQPRSSSRATTWPRASGVVARGEDRRVAVADARRVDHHRGGDRVERLDHPSLGKGTLDLLGQRVGVLDAERRRETLGEVERVRGVEEDLAGEVVRPDLAERRQRGETVGRVDHELRVGGHDPQLAQGYVEVRPLLAPLGGVGITGADDHVVPHVSKSLGQGPAHDPRADDRDPHSPSVGPIHRVGP